MSNKRRLTQVKVYPKGATELVEKFGEEQGSPLSRRQRRSIRVNVPLGSYRVDHSEKHNSNAMCGAKCRPNWR